jgi:hypothetical protein
MKTPSLRGRKAAPTGKVSAALFPQAQQLKVFKPNAERATIQTLTTTPLENLARYYERGSGVVNKFERTTILKGIATELAERTAEKVELRKGDR